MAATERHGSTNLQQLMGSLYKPASSAATDTVSQGDVVGTTNPVKIEGIQQQLMLSKLLKDLKSESTAHLLPKGL